jgi:hypothetical protein
MLKTVRLNIRFSESEVAELEAVNAALGLPTSGTLRFLIHEKYRDLVKGEAPTHGKKKRRSAPG